jgi:hypothetical protein
MDDGVAAANVVGQLLDEVVGRLREGLLHDHVTVGAGEIVVQRPAQQSVLGGDRRNKDACALGHGGEVY